MIEALDRLFTPDTTGLIVSLTFMGFGISEILVGHFLFGIKLRMIKSELEIPGLLPPRKKELEEQLKAQKIMVYGMLLIGIVAIIVSLYGLIRVLLA